MSKSVAKASEKGLEEPQNDSVFDFLYCDVRRIASFLAQFDESGALEKVVRHESVTRTRQRGVKLSLGGGATVLGTGGQGAVGFERGPGDQGTEGLERSFDPLWSNAREFLDFLESGSLLERDVERAQIGQFVLSEGSVCIFDNSLLKEAWSIRAIREQMISASAPPLNAQKPKGRDDIRKQYDSAFEFLKLMPHVIQCGLQTKEEVKIWSILSAENLVTSATDLLLKEAGVPSGTWNMVGIKDCNPFFGNVSIDLSVLGAFGTVAAHFAPVIQGMLGRPTGSYGVTPLLIFREVLATQ